MFTITDLYNPATRQEETPPKALQAVWKEPVYDTFASVTKAAFWWDSCHYRHGQRVYGKSSVSLKINVVSKRQSHSDI